MNLTLTFLFINMFHGSYTSVEQHENEMLTKDLSRSFVTKTIPLINVLDVTVYNSSEDITPKKEKY